MRWFFELKRFNDDDESDIIGLTYKVIGVIQLAHTYTHTHFLQEETILKRFLCRNMQHEWRNKQMN